MLRMVDCVLVLGLSVLSTAMNCPEVEDPKEKTVDVERELERLQGEWMLTTFEIRESTHRPLFHRRRWRDGS